MLFNCQHCEDEDDVDDMVQCDMCDQLSHFYCVGVTMKIKDLSWACPKCMELMKKALEEKRRELEKDESAFCSREMASVEKEFAKEAISFRVPENVLNIELQQLGAASTEIMEDVSYGQAGTSSSKVTGVFNKNNLGVTESNYQEFVNSLNVQSKYDELKKLYDDINIKDERKFIKACIDSTFCPDLIGRISFNTGKVPIDNTKLLTCLIEALQTKSKNKFDDMEARDEIKRCFERMRNLKCQKRRIEKMRKM